MGLDGGGCVLIKCYLQKQVVAGVGPYKTRICDIKKKGDVHRDEIKAKVRTLVRSTHHRSAPQGAAGWGLFCEHSSRRVGDDPTLPAGRTPARCLEGVQG